MHLIEAKVGVRIKSNRTFAGIPVGTQGVIDEDYGTGVTVAWDLPDRPLPDGYTQWDGSPAITPGLPLRDGFDKDTELDFLDLVE
jgi:hypothetical protein